MEVVVTPQPNQLAPIGWEEEVATKGKREGDEVMLKESNTMPSTTLLKYNRFKGDGSKDVDKWLTEFESTSLANQEELASK